MKSAFVSGHFPSLIFSQEFCILLIRFCFLRFLSWSVGQNAAWIKLKSDSLYGYMACALRLFASSPKETLHKGVVDYFTDRPLTHLRLTINLISTFCTQFQLFALFGINWRAVSKWTCWDFCMYIITTVTTIKCCVAFIKQFQSLKQRIMLKTGEPQPLQSALLGKYQHFHQDICIGNSMIWSDIWHKYHEWYFEIVICNFTSR